jgi:hypothetical protein
LLLHSHVNAHPAPWHDLRFKQLATVWDEGIPLGNGMVGAIVWQKDGQLRFALDRSDLWDERPMKGLHRKEFSYKWVSEQVKQNNYSVVQQYFDAPYDREAGPSKISGGALEFDSKEWGDVTSVHLALQNALCTVTWNNGIVLKTFVHATKPVGWFRFENIPGDLEPAIKSPGYENKSGKPLDSLKSNDPAKLGYEKGIIVKKVNRISYHQPGYNGFYYDIVVEWKRISRNTIEGVWAVSSNYSKENINAAQLIQQAFLRGYKTELNTHINWWKNFWNKSSVQLPDSLLERQWYLDQYKFGSTARKGVPPILLQGVWTADNGRLPPWKGDYHHDLNTEMSYWPAYSANHLDEAMGFIDHLEKNKPNYRRYTQLYFNVKGINVPGVTTLAGTEMGGWIQYALSPTISAWLAQHYYLQWKYSMDAALLKNKTYPWFKEVAAYLENITTKDSDGFRILPASSSPEINNNAVNAWFSQLTNYDLSLMRFVFEAGGEMAAYQNLKADELHFKKLLSECRQLAVSANNELMYAPGVPYEASHRHFSHAMSIYPLGLVKWEDGETSQRVIKNSIAQLDSVGPANWNGYSYSWLACLDARAKNGEAAAKALRIFAAAFCSVNSFHVNGDQTKSGYSSRNYRPFTLEGNFGAAAALQEMLLQSYTGFIEVFPAIPAAWKNVSFTTLRAEGAFLVSAKKINGKVSEIKIVSEKGGVTKLKLPFENYKVLHAKGITVSKTGKGFVQLNCKINGTITMKCENVVNVEMW